MRSYEVVFNEIEDKENLSVDYLNIRVISLFMHSVFLKKNKRTGLLYRVINDRNSRENREKFSNCIQ